MLNRGVSVPLQSFQIVNCRPYQSLLNLFRYVIGIIRVRAKLFRRPRNLLRDHDRHPDDCGVGRQHTYTDSGSDVAGSIGTGVFKALDSLLSIFEGPLPDPRPAPADRAAFKASAEEALKQQARQQDETAREHEAKQKAPWD